MLAPTAIDWCNEVHSLVKGGALDAKDRPIPQVWQSLFTHRLTGGSKHFEPFAHGSLGSALPQAREWKGEHVYAVDGLSPADPNAALISVFSAGAAEIEHGVARL